MSAPRLPDFVLAGAAKCGTTSLAAWLAAHPDVYMPGHELHFFNREDNWGRGLDWYAGHFTDAGEARVVGEETPAYMVGAPTVRRMAEVLPGARILVCLRDPVERAYSHWRHWHFRRAVDPRSFAQAVEEELSGAVARRAVPGFGGYDPDEPMYLGKSRYVPQLDLLCEHFGRERVHVVLLEDMKRDPQAVFAGVCRHLGVDDAVVPENLGSRENAAFEFRPLWFWFWLVRNQKRMPAPLAKFLALKVVRRRPARPEPLDPALRARLREAFADDDRALAAWLGRELPW